MARLGDVIEIESSPEPYPAATLKSREKGKGKATPYRPELASSVIEITDSEDEDDEGKASTSHRVGPSHSSSHTGPGPSSPTRTFIKSYPAGPNGSLDNVAMPLQQNGMLASGSGSGTEACPTEQKLNGDNHNSPLFLSSNDEHESPAPAPDTAHTGRVEVDAARTSVIEREPAILTPETQSLKSTPTTPDLDPIPTEDMDPISTAVAQILEIIPNVEPTHLLQLIETHLPTYSVFHGNHDPDVNGGEGAAAAAGGGGGEREVTVEEQVQGVVGHVLHLLFENPDYPKADLRAGGKGKGKRVGDPNDEDGLEGKGKAKDPSPKKPKIDYTSIDRPFSGGPNYFDLALVGPFLH
jgi:E3 ubiquitin-protein ligase RNF216